jgi:nitroreductase/NAD-dependent dihydropyrimidine dehydrogenase PreA subunit
MKQVIIDRRKCTACGLCAGVCPDGAIVLGKDCAEHGGGECLLCGHCRAVCPAAAVTLPDRPDRLGLTTMSENTDVVPPGAASCAELVALMRSRRSCRSYRQEAVPLGALADLVKIGTTAPSGTNSQGWNFIILPCRDDLLALGGLVAAYYKRLNRLAESPLLRLAVKWVGGDSLGRYHRNYYQSVAEALRQWDEEGRDRLFHGAAAAILVTGGRGASCPAEDALLATQNMLLAAHAMGLGSCLIGFAVEAIRRSPTIRERLEIPATEEIYSVIAIGYPAVDFLRPAGRKEVKPRILGLAARTLVGNGEKK